MRHHEPGDLTVAVTRLAKQVDEHQAALDALDTVRVEVAAHQRTLNDLADLLRNLAAARQTPPSSKGQEPDDAPDWLSVRDAATAVRWLNDLVAWMPTVWALYVPIAPCWPWHPPVVAELLVQHHLWRVATTPGVGPDLLAGWHDRWRPGAATRTGRWLAGCERAGTHVDRTGRHYLVDLSIVDELAEWWATSHGTDRDSPTPGLAPETTR